MQQQNLENEVNIEERQTFQLALFYAGFRVLLSFVLIALNIVSKEYNLQTDYNSDNFFYISLLYCCLSVIQGLYQLLQLNKASTAHIFASIIIDILFFTGLMYFSENFSVTIALLLSIPVAISAIFFSGKMAMVFAALATISCIFDAFFGTLNEGIDSEKVVASGILGLVFFTISIGIQLLSTRIRATQALAEKFEVKAADLSEISQHIVEQIRTGLIIFDQNNKIELINPAAEKILSIESVRDIQQTPIFDAVKIWKGNNDHIHYITSPSGIELQISFAKLKNNFHSVAFIENVTEIAQKAQQMKLASLGKLSASIAHEIRNPLSAISYSNQLLVEAIKNNPSDLELLEIAQNNIKRIDSIISNILDMSKDRNYQPSQIDLVVFIESLIEELSLTSEDHTNIIFEHDPKNEYQTSFDKIQLRQVLVNLIENALRYSLQSSGKQKILLRLKLDPKHGTSKLDIIDYGPGINIEDKSAIFEPFYTTEKTGTGLGLYLSRELCILNQATINLTETSPNGSTFTIEFAHPNRNIRLVETPEKE